MTNDRREPHLSYLDALRGIASVWVVASHTANLNGFSHTVILEGSLAVDLFMMLSGFLMVYHYMRRRIREPWESHETWVAFWLRRFFRIAPAYYAVLFVALAIREPLGVSYAGIGDVFSVTTEPARFSDASATNIVLHLSFLFSLLPEYVSRTPLPDWSIGLEVMFYAVFPLIMLGFARSAAGIILLLVAVAALLHLAFPGYFTSFPQPAALPMQIHTFATGMLFAAALLETRRRRAARLAGLGLLMPLLAALLGLEVMEASLVQTLIAGGLGAIVFHRRLRRIVPGLGGLVSFLAARPFRFLGDVSYGLYLVHLPVAILVIGWLAEQPYYQALGTAERVVLAFALIVPAALALAAGLYHAVEMPGIAIGRRLVAHLGARRAAPLRALARRS